MPFDGSQLDEVTKILIEGRSKIENGWCQKAFCIGDSYCMFGAIRDDGYNVDLKAFARLTAALGFSSAPDASIRLIKFNDNPNRTKEEVLAVFDRAISDKDI